MIKFILFAFIISCSTSPRGSLPQEASVLKKNHSSVKEARNYIRNKWNYIYLLFEQSHDPYYGTPRWSQECLKNNTLGKVRENNGNIFFVSRFLLNDKKEPGFCEGIDTEVIHLHCANDLATYEIHCAPGNCEKIIKSNPCPLI